MPPKSRYMASAALAARGYSEPEPAFGCSLINLERPALGRKRPFPSFATLNMQGLCPPSFGGRTNVA